MPMKDILGWLFILIFAATAMITLLGLIGRVQIRDRFLKALFAALIIEVIGTVILLFRSFWMVADIPESQHTVEKFYSSIQARDWEGAYELIAEDSDFKNKVSLSDFTLGYQSTIGVNLLAILPSTRESDYLHEYIVYYQDEFHDQVPYGLKDVSSLRVSQLPILNQNLESLAQRAVDLGFRKKTIHELTIDQITAPNAGAKIAFLLQRDAPGIDCTPLFLPAVARREVRAYKIKAQRSKDTPWRIWKLIELH